ncbi:MAG: hypothetical protein GWN84_11995, partial [Gammaproteobacteria bacterium]|nr:hypothetical protein [Gammaproteobacteria bacterium]NIR85109.1 hypothetical protein [Gammaproteobacteria bacterium]NIU06158.1 hypothetical protein [Gammaproteobacteria bacterium]NIV51793.1 hypothetical protein [Gammaproteobacteria bacterium]NIX87431.1 hypothetical protein [Gammaproteobacteria bacterium]
LKRYQDRLDREIAAVRTQAEREIETLRMTYTNGAESLKNSYEMRLEGQRETISRLE